MAAGKNITRERGSEIIFREILRLFGRISRDEKGEGEGNLGEVNQDFKKWELGRISSCRELFTHFRVANSTQ